MSVFNTGKNIPENELENIWIKFYKVDKARTRAYGGNGIGLSIVKALWTDTKRNVEQLTDRMVLNFGLSLIAIH